MLDHARNPGGDSSPPVHSQILVVPVFPRLVNIDVRVDACSRACQRRDGAIRGIRGQSEELGTQQGRRAGGRGGEGWGGARWKMRTARHAEECELPICASGRHCHLPL